MHNTPNPTDKKFWTTERSKGWLFVFASLFSSSKSQEKVAPQQDKLSPEKITIIFALLSKRYFSWRKLFFLLVSFLVMLQALYHPDHDQYFLCFIGRNLKKYIERDECTVCKYIYFDGVFFISNAMSYKDHVCYTIFVTVPGRVSR